MRKSIITGVAGAAMCLSFTGCHQYDFTPISDGEAAYQNYENVFIEKYGEPAPDHTWGFGSTTSGMTRSAAAPEVLGINAPYTEAWVAEYLTTAKEPNSTNIAANAENDKRPQWQWSSEYNTKRYTTGFTSEEQAFYDNNIKPYDDGKLEFYGITNWDWSAAWYEVYKRVIAGGYNSWVNVTGEPTFVSNFKITDTWDGNIGVLATEGLTDGKANGNERTVVVTGTWNMIVSESEKEQRVGGKGRIIVANGGKINIPAGFSLNSVNEAQIVVLPGGKITGEGAIAFNNGTSNDLASYNGGTIDVKKFNNNGGNFFNYGTLKTETMDGGAGNSRYYNHNIINIQNTGSSANLRIFNNCQFYCSGNMRARNYEGKQGSSLICGGELMFSSSEDGTGEETYVGLAAGALVQCGTLNNNGTKWYGSTTGGYAVLDITDKITFINNQAGDFANNIYVCAGTWDNTLSQGNFGGKTAKEAIKTIKTNTVTIIEKSTDDNDNLIPTSEDFVAGVSGCTPGFNGKIPTAPTPLRIIAEDLPASAGDFDFNDVVFDVQLNWPATGKHTITLQAAGGTMPLYIGNVSGKEIEFSNGKPNYEGDYFEVHKAFGVETGKMVNTAEWTATKDPVTIVITGNYSNENEIAVRVKKGNDLPLLTAETGKVPSKLAVPATYKWCEELKNIEVVYGDKFKEYIGDPSVIWYEPTPETGVYNKK